MHEAMNELQKNLNIDDQPLRLSSKESSKKTSRNSKANEESPVSKSKEGELQVLKLTSATKSPTHQESANQSPHESDTDGERISRSSDQDSEEGSDSHLVTITELTNESNSQLDVSNVSYS